MGTEPSKQAWSPPSMNQLQNHIAGVLTAENWRACSAWAASAKAARLRRVTAFVAMICALDAMDTGLATHTSAALTAWARNRPMESLASFCTTAAWIAAIWGLVLVLESCTSTAKQDMQARPNTELRTARKKQKRKRVKHKTAPGAMRDQLPSQATSKTAGRSNEALRTELLGSSVTLKHWTGSVIDRSHAATVDETLDTTLDALLWRFGPNPLALLSALTEQVATWKICRAKHPDIEITVMRRVIRIGWTTVPMMLQPMVGDETYLELHEDLVVCPQAQIAVSRVWNGNFRWLVHYQARSTFTHGPANTTLINAQFVATSTSWLGSVLTQMLQSGGETTLWDMVANDVTKAALRRRDCKVEKEQFGHTPGSRYLSRDTDVPAIDPIPDLPLLPLGLITEEPQQGPCDA